MKRCGEIYFDFVSILNRQIQKGLYKDLSLLLISLKNQIMELVQVQASNCARSGHALSKWAKTSSNEYSSGMACPVASVIIDFQSKL